MEFGTKKRFAKCVEGMNGGKTCLDLIGDTSQRKVEKETCAGEVKEVIKYCPVNHKFLSWTSWSNCPSCVNPSEPKPKRKRTRKCIDGKHGGSECPPQVR